MLYKSLKDLSQWRTLKFILHIHVLILVELL
uniref:Uncharacterized protein n=1 Tax=Arundo donax TaxID=35708 RepID=A0A0A9B951_ARUDO